MKKLLIKRTLIPTDCYIIRVYSNDEYFNDCNWLYVELSEELKREISITHELILQGKKLLPESMYAIKLWCNAPYWLHDAELLTSENCDDHFPKRAIDPLNCKEDYKEVTKMEVEINATGEICADACQLVVDDFDFRFQCYVKNTNILLYSESMEVLSIIKQESK